VYNPFDFFLEPLRRSSVRYDDWQLHELAPFLVKSPATPRFADYLAASARARQTIDFLVDVNKRLQQDIGYVIRLERESRRSTRRSASARLVPRHRLAARPAAAPHGARRPLRLRLPDPAHPDQKSLDGPSGTDHDFTDLHAVRGLPAGRRLDRPRSTSGLLAGEVTSARLLAGAGVGAPITGMVEDCEVEFEHTMRVDRVWEAPRVTSPTATNSGSRSTRSAAGSTATSSPPTSASPGWRADLRQRRRPRRRGVNTAALGPVKRKVAADLLAKLRAKYAPRGLVHYGQGKWYPGEQLRAGR